MYIRFKIYFFTLFMVLISYAAKSQQEGSIGIGTTSPSNKAILDISSSDKGVLLPRLTQQQRDALQQPAQNNPVLSGLLIYNTTTHKFNYWDGSDWKATAPSSTISGNTWYVGTLPSTGTVVDGDYYLDNAGNCFQRLAGSWVNQINLKGIPGTGLKRDVALQAPALVVPANGAISRAFPINGIQPGDAVSISVNPSLLNYFSYVSIANASVTAAGIVTVTFINNRGSDITIPPGTLFVFASIW